MAYFVLIGWNGEVLYKSFRVILKSISTIPLSVLFINLSLLLKYMKISFRLHLPILQRSIRISSFVSPFLPFLFENICFHPLRPILHNMSTSSTNSPSVRALSIHMGFVRCEWLHKVHINSTVFAEEVPAYIVSSPGFVYKCRLYTEARLLI